MVVVLRLDHSDGHAGLGVQDVVGFLGFISTNRLAADDDTALGEEDVLAQLGHRIPPDDAAANERRCDELGTAVGFSRLLLVHRAASGLPEFRECERQLAMVADRQQIDRRARLCVKHQVVAVKVLAQGVCCTWWQRAQLRQRFG